MTITTSNQFDSVQEKLLATLDQSLAWVQKLGSETETFVREQTPLVIQEFLVWGFWQHTILFAFLLAGCLVCLGCALWTWKRFKTIRKMRLKALETKY